MGVGDDDTMAIRPCSFTIGSTKKKINKNKKKFVNDLLMSGLKTNIELIKVFLYNYIFRIISALLFEN